MHTASMCHPNRRKGIGNLKISKASLPALTFSYALLDLESSPWTLSVVTVGDTLSYHYYG